MKDYEVTIGLEVHAELKTNTKCFCSCKNEFGGEPNTHCCPVCVGMPGALPVINKRAVELTIKAGLCMGCDINDIAVFERKNYFYPDLSKAYQISQLIRPICLHGGVKLDSGKFIRLNRIHLEEDAGKLVHKSETVGTLIDYNRGGVPLIEMVSEPDMSSPEEALEFLGKLRENLIYADIAECKMQEGGMRCDVNVSIREKGQKEYGTKVEMKNINSFKAVERAIKFEVERQKDILENGGTVRQETRRWDDVLGESSSMRSKEDSKDYRYFPDPDILAIEIPRENVEKIRKELPLLPAERKEKYMGEFGLSLYDTNLLLSEKVYSNFFDECVKLYNKPKSVVNWIQSQVLSLIKDEEEKEIKISASNLTKIIEMLEKKEISQQDSRTLFAKCWEEDIDAKEFAKSSGMLSTLSENELEKIMDEVISENPKACEDFKTTPDKVMPFFIGQVMKKTKGKANSEVVRKYFTEKLK